MKIIKNLQKNKNIAKQALALALIGMATPQPGFCGKKQPPIRSLASDDAPTPSEASRKQSPEFNMKLTSQNVFKFYMDEFPVRSLFRRAQWEHLNTPEDTAFTHFFYEANEYFGQLFDQLKELHNGSLEDFSRYAQANMLKLRPGYTKTYDRVHKTISDVATSIGFSSEAVNNLEIYLTDGDMQAFTVSGNNNRIIVVVETALLERLSEYEVRAVLAHELGHIRSLHSVKHSMHQLFMNLALGYYASPSAIASAQATSNSTEAANLNLFKMNNLNSDKIFLRKGRLTHAGHNDDRREQFKGQNTGSLIAQKVNELLRLPPDQQKALVDSYLRLLIDVLQAENGSPQSVHYFMQLLNTQSAQYATHNLDVQKFIYFAEQAESAISRAQEKSSDRYMTANVPNEYGVSTIAKLAGHPFQPDPKVARAEFEAVSKMIQLQVEEFFQKYGGEDLSAYVGESHPATSLRLVNILNTPHYPDLLFANSFLRLLLLEDLMRSEVTKDKSLKKYMTALQKDIVELVDGFGLTSKTNARFNKLVQFYALNKRIQLEQLNQFKSRAIPDVFNESQKIYFATTIKESEIAATQLSPVLLNLQTLLTAKVSQAKKEIDTLLAQKQEVRQAQTNLVILERRLTIINQLILSQNPQELEALHAGTIHPDAVGTQAEKRNLPVRTSITSNPLGASARCKALLSTLDEVDEMLQQKNMNASANTK